MIQQNRVEVSNMIAPQRLEEHPFYFGNIEDGVRLFGIIYKPEKPIGIGIVFLHPIGPERVIGDTVPVNIARSLAAQGIVCLRFDYTGTGDSEGEFRDITKATLFSDIAAAITTLEKVEGVNSVGLFGLRFGGMVASLYAEQEDSRVEHLILCSPIVDFPDYLNKALMMSIASQPVIFGKVIADRAILMQGLIDGVETIHEGINLRNIDGFPLTQKLWSSFREHKLQEVGSYKKRCLVIDLSIPGKKKDPIISELAARYGENAGYKEISVKYLPWVHNSSLLISSINELNECVTQWVSAGGR